jgi:hypothetical protein
MTTTDKLTLQYVEQTREYYTRFGHEPTEDESHLLSSHKERVKYTAERLEIKPEEVTPVIIENLLEFGKRRSGFTRMYNRVLRAVTLWGLFLDWAEAADARFWVVIGFGCSSILTTFLLTHVTRISNGEDDPPANIASGLQHLFTGFALFALISVLFYEVPRLWRRYNPIEYYLVYDSGVIDPKRAHINYNVFLEIMKKRRKWDTDARLYRFEYDPYHDDPYVAAVYYILKERSQTFNKPFKKRKK